MISYDEALALIADEAAPLDTEAVAPAEALGRVLASDVVATRSLPPFDNTAMDGFALRAKDSQNAPCDLPVLGSVAAGDVPDMAEQAGAVEIMTGAPVPDWCDGVVPVENVDVVRDVAGVPTRITVKAPILKGAHIRRAGEDVQAGKALLAAGGTLTPLNHSFPLLRIYFWKPCVPVWFSHYMRYIKSISLINGFFIQLPTADKTYLIYF